MESGSANMDNCNYVYEGRPTPTKAPTLAGGFLWGRALLKEVSMTLYEVAVVTDDEILLEPTVVLANDEKSAILIIGLRHLTRDTIKAKVLVRPFV